MEMIGANEDRTRDHAIPAQHKVCSRTGLTATEGRQEPRMQQWNEGPRLKRTATPEKGEDIGRIFRKTVKVETGKRIVRSLTRL
jgi:hypothetical protein